MKTLPSNKKKTVWLIGFFAALACLCGVSMLVLRANKAENLTACIYQDAVLVKEFDFTALEEPVEFSIGEHAIVMADKDGIFMKEADCPDQFCVMRGKISNIGIPIVCLPNHIIITITQNDTRGLDAVAG